MFWCRFSVCGGVSGMVRRRFVFGLAVVVISVIGGAIFIGPLLSGLIGTSGGVDPAVLSGYMEGKESDIVGVMILGNSSDIVYPELAIAVFVPLLSGEWNVSAYFLNDSLGPYNMTFYDVVFQIGVSEVESINDAIYAGLESTDVSTDTLDDLGWPSVGFGVDVLYSDGTWVQLFTVQSAKGHVMFMNGTYTGTLDPSDPFDPANIDRDENWQNGVFLEPASSLDGLVSAMNAVFVDHLG